MAAQIIVVPPFAEEMNKSRRMFTLLARAARSRGMGVLIFDPHGTGDSEGDFSDARWETWKGDVAAVAAYLAESGATAISALGMRTGALLATECVCEGLLNAKRVVLWQPVVAGNVFVTQFLRLRIAAKMGEEKNETTQTLRQKLAAGEALEIAGYALSPALASAIDSASLKGLAPKAAIHWLEVATTSSFSAASRAVIDGWKANTEVSETLIAGPPFWATSEITLVPELIEKTLAAHD